MTQSKLVPSDAPESKRRRTSPSFWGKRGSFGQKNGCAILGYENQLCRMATELITKPTPTFSAASLLAAIRADALVQKRALGLDQRTTG